MNMDYSTTMMPRTVQAIFPRRQVVTFKQTMIAFYTVATAQSTGAFSIQASSFYAPFDNVTNKIGVTGANKSNLTLNGAYSTTQNPYGYTEFNSLYTYYKVRKSTCKVTVSSLADEVFVAMAPSPSQITTYVPIQTGSQPYSKQKLANAGGPPRVVSCSIASPTVLGYNATQFEGLAPTLMGTSPGSTTQWFWNITWCNPTGASPSGNLFFEIELWQDVEVSELVNWSS